MDGTHLLHGRLHASVFQAKHLLHSFAKVLHKAVDAVEDVLHISHISHTGLYATIDIGPIRVARTRILHHKPSDPVWNESFDVLCAYAASSIVVSIKEELPVSAHVVGRAKIPITELLHGKVAEGWFPLYKEDFSELLHKSQVHVRLQFQAVEDEPRWGRGIGGHDFQGVDKVFFKQKLGCTVRLYQNSHLSQNFSPRIELGHGAARHLYSPNRLWEDVYRYVLGAKHFVYIAGWSVNVNITLVRDEERMIEGAEGVTLGELLKKKADEGVRVLVLIWDDRTAVKLLNYDGIMQTHGEGTFSYFKDTNVHCVLCPRNADRTLSAVQGAEAYLEFTHHQKAISLDAPAAAGCRTVVSFVGGIDLCDGRYDDEKHSLFRTLNTVHKYDFHQNNFKGANILRGGPREPWHDAHSLIQGPAAYDVLENFVHRWLKQARKPELLLNINEINGLLGADESVTHGPASWNVQVFRSIDDASVVGFPRNWEEASELGLCTVKNQVVEKSIEKAYIEAIRRANHFIYIENQYFFGGCALWDRDQDSGCEHLIPAEIALKIVSKIKARERFAAYILTPMWPEGIPEGNTVQDILHWFRNTARMMYSMIGQALAEEGLASEYSPTDYLNFFCLGNREIKLPGEYEPPERPEQGTDYWNAQLHRRFLIYIHAKLMIVDDEYIIVGSANLNQRSMDGARDTEIAQGCYQPYETNREKHRARGEIYGYRMSLWCEHFGAKHGRFQHEYLYPESVECVRTLKKISQRNWEYYICEETLEDLPGHLLPFPLTVLHDGSLEDDSERVFPDTNASVQGHSSYTLPPLLTT